MEKDYDENGVKIAEKMFDLAQYEYSSEYDRLNRLENKIYKILTLSSAPIIALIFQMYSINSNDNILRNGLVMISTILLLFGVVILLSLLYPVSYIRANLDTELNIGRFDKSYEEVLYQMAINFKSYMESNRTKINEEINILRQAMRCVYIASLLILINFIFF